MAFAMYQFTKGEGRLNTTQDLFTQAEYFAEEANRLYKIVRQFSYQVKTQIFLVMHVMHIKVRLYYDTMLPFHCYIPGTSRNDEKRIVRATR